jgi:hypothetical protein
MASELTGPLLSSTVVAPFCLGQRREARMNVRVRVGRASRIFLSASAASATLLVGAAAPASAGTLDQQQTNGSSSTQVHSNQSVAQTFTAGLSGGLDQVDLYLDKEGIPTAPLNVEIRDAFGGAPGNAVLASFSVPNPAVPADPGFLSIPFAAPAPVTAGTQYAIVAHSVTAQVNRYEWRRSPFDTYAGGAPFVSPQSPPLGGWSVPLSLDQAFRTYVAVPPSAATNTFTLGKVKRNKKKGTATINLTVPNPGELTGSGKGVKASSAGQAQTSKAVAAGPTKLLISAKGKKLKKLKKTGKVKLKVAITYTPTGGQPNTQAKKVKLIKKL